MRRKEPRWSHRFELAPENVFDVRLHEHLLALAEKGEAAQWIRQTLIEAVIHRVSTVDTPVIQSGYPDAPPSVEPEHPTDFKSMNDNFLRKSQGLPLARPAPKPGAAQPSGLSPQEILARAQAKKDNQP